MLGRPRIGAPQQAMEHARAELSGLFAAAGFPAIDVPYLFLGETLLDVYGEDLRARAFLFPDAERGNELCLRPDFTVPVALAHGQGGWDRHARYAYQGPVFRRQPRGQGRPTEYLQAGLEQFGAPDPARADAQVFALLHRGLATLGIAEPEVQIGDLSVAFALLDALDMPERRRAGLKRHFWRPQRFQALIERACAPPAPSDLRTALMSDPTPAMARGEALGLRTRDEIAERIETLAEEMRAPAMAQADADLLNAVLGLECSAPEAPARLAALTGEQAVRVAAERLAARLEALSAEGIDPARMVFDANFGRNLEYYDGFVFEMRAPGRTAHPPLAGGGRYDALPARLGADGPVPAIGGIIRPDAVLELLP